MDPTALVRESTARIVQRAGHVSIDSGAVGRLAAKLSARLSGDEHGAVTWDSGDFHYFEDVTQDGPLTLASWFHPFTPPQLDERRRKVREVGDVLQQFFDGQALNLIKKANFSAVEAVRLVLAYFPADYRVPQVLRPESVLVYSSELAQLVDNKAEIPAGSEMELEIRAATIQAVELIHEQMIIKGHHLEVIELDWLLWQIGEDNKEHLLPYHRTWSIYY
ncbi:Voltage-dependent anion-selective channel protein 2 [Phytophthora nicotianae]|uniref:Queuosine 5'-phosphate N-glycosylase/hydrolase n=1 Tax=Phytophthora nicotianae TaxID=4792 RepID=A0A0W8CUG0_PHYNI|nr:Voltage-dependent anion-selective channel protein 2 [Phytophthora nicotianae]